jgi:L-ascorbate metabolism protein UlaG (beta-lactamase superfamily)
MQATRFAQSLLALVLCSGWSFALSQNVKITPLGSHAGEFCDRDRATIFEDPTGVRILYDAGHSVTGGDDPRLGDVHVVLLSHAHGDHMGDRKMSALNAGTCDKPETVSAAPHSTTAEIAAKKNAALIMIANMGAFVGKKVENIRGKPTGACAESAGSTIVPVAAPCLATMQLGGTKRVKTANAARAVEITTVHAAHDSTMARELLSDPEKKNLEPDNVSLSLGAPSGYVVKFTNGLTAYLSGDTGLHTEMRTVVRDFYRVNLAVLNLGPNAISPEAAAYAINDLIRPAAVIASHPNEGATSGGIARPNSRTKQFMDLVKRGPVYPAISGRTMEFDGSAKCVAGC